MADPASLDLDSVWDTEWEKNLAEAAKERVKQKVSAQQFQMFEQYVVQGWPVREGAVKKGSGTAQIRAARFKRSAKITRRT